MGLGSGIPDPASKRRIPDSYPQHKNKKHAEFLPVDHDWLGLANPVAAVLGLKILLRVPVAEIRRNIDDSIFLPKKETPIDRGSEGKF